MNIKKLFQKEYEPKEINELKNKNNENEHILSSKDIDNMLNNQINNNIDDLKFRTNKNMIKNSNSYSDMNYIQKLDFLEKNIDKPSVINSSLQDIIQNGFNSYYNNFNKNHRDLFDCAPSNRTCFACDVNCSISRSGYSPMTYSFKKNKIKRRSVTPINKK